MKALGLVGWSGAGKTTLLTALIPVFLARGLRISTIKHAHHALDLDQPGMVATAARFTLFSEHRAAPEPDLGALMARLAPVDLVLVEGFKSHDFPKIEIYRASLGKPPLWPQIDVMAVASDQAVENCPHPVLDLNAPETVACFIIGRLGLHTAPGHKE